MLVPLLSDENALVRQTTATALGLIGQASALQALLGCRMDQDEHVRYAVEQALEQIDPGGSIRMDAEIAALAENLPGYSTPQQAG